MKRRISMGEIGGAIALVGVGGLLTLGIYSFFTLGFLWGLAAICFVCVLVGGFLADACW